MDVRIGPYRRLSTEELMLSHCGAGERLLRVPWTARRSINPKRNQSWIFTGRTDAEVEAPILWPPDVKSQLTDGWERLWCWERLKTGREADNRACDGWMAPPTQWTWAWAKGKLWGKPGVLLSMGWQSTGHDWATGKQQSRHPRAYHHHGHGPSDNLPCVGGVLFGSSCILNRIHTCKDVPVVHILQDRENGTKYQAHSDQKQLF